jgi:hypothetical protein
LTGAFNQFWNCSAPKTTMAWLPKNRRILHESACMLAGGCTPKWPQFRRPSELAVPTVLLSEKYSCTDRYSTIARHFIYSCMVLDLAYMYAARSQVKTSVRIGTASLPLAIWSASYSSLRVHPFIPPSAMPCVRPDPLGVVTCRAYSYMCGAPLARCAIGETHMFLPYKIQTSVANCGQQVERIPYFWF